LTEISTALSINAAFGWNLISQRFWLIFALALFKFYCNKISRTISVSPCSASPCLNDGSCTVDVNGEAVCACNGEWSGFYCSGLFYIYGQIRIYLCIKLTISYLGGQ
jgi:hypothetical protein